MIELEALNWRELGLQSLVGVPKVFQGQLVGTGAKNVNAPQSIHRMSAANLRKQTKILRWSKKCSPKSLGYTFETDGGSL